MIAITGASGFIGSYIADKFHLPQKRLSRNRVAHSKTKELQWIQGDLEDAAVLQHFINDSPTLIHLACSTYPRSSNLDIKQDIQRNLVSTVKLFEAYAKANPGGHIIYSSSGGNMYDATLDKILRTENDFPRPQSSYGIHKLASENYLRLFCEMYGIRGTILRISNPYGVPLPKQRPQGLIGVALAKLIAAEPLQIFDSLESVRDYIHLDDVTSAFNLAIENPPEESQCHLYNVSSGVGYTLNEVLKLIEEAVGRTFIRQISSDKIPSPSFSVLSYQKMKKTLGWTPQINLKQGIYTTWTQYLNINHK